MQIGVITRRLMQNGNEAVVYDRDLAARRAPDDMINEARPS
jgi:hypothetical protein